MNRMVDERHQRAKQPVVPIRKSFSGHDRSQPIDPFAATLIQSKTVDLHVPYNYSYQDIIAEHNYQYSLAKQKQSRQQGSSARKSMMQHHYT
jgi:hypothetical protein